MCSDDLRREIAELKVGVKALEFLVSQLFALAAQRLGLSDEDLDELGDAAGLVLEDVRVDAELFLAG
ncbi:MAG: hypothetical protein ACPHK8_07590 [Thermoplasmatota archaeon]